MAVSSITHVNGEKTLSANVLQDIVIVPKSYLTGLQLDHCSVESLGDVCVFFLSTHQMNQIRPYVCQETAENGLAGVTLSNNSPAPLYIHQSAVSYLGQVYTLVFKGLGVPDTSVLPLLPNTSSLSQKWLVMPSPSLGGWFHL